MKEEEFLKRINEDLDISIQYALDDDGNIILDEEGTRETFENKLEQIKMVVSNE